MGLFDKLTDDAGAAVAEPVQEQQQNNQPAAAPSAPAEQPGAAGGENTQSQSANIQQQSNAPAASASIQEPINFDKIIDEMSGGVIKDASTLKAYLPRITKFEELENSHKELTAKMAQAPVFVDDEVRILNELKSKGASKEQIKSFHKINEYGNLAEIPDRETLIAKRVLIDGAKPSVAEAMVDRQYKIGDDSIEGLDREIQDDQLRVDAIKDREALEAFKSKVSQAPGNPEEQQLQAQARLVEHQKTIKPYVSELVSTLTNMGAVDLAGDGGVDANKFELLPLNEATRAETAQLIENFFMDGTTPVTPESTREAMAYARAIQIEKNLPKILNDAFQRGVSLTTERLTNKSENRSGLKEPKDNPLMGDMSDETKTANFAKGVAERRA